METFKIKAVLAAIEYKSLSKAAEKYSYTPSAFSHMLSAFEAELGVRIFNRSSTGVELTEAGRLLYPDLVAVVNSEKRLAQTLEKIKNESKAVLRIGTYPSISRTFLSEIIKDFCAEHPSVKIYLSVVDSLSGWLEGGQADVIFADEGAFKTIDWVPLATDRCVAIAPSGYFTEKSLITRDEMYLHPHLLTDFGCTQNYFDEQKFKQVIHLTSEDDLSVINLVKQGLGLTVIPELVLRGNSDGVMKITLEPQVCRTIGFAYDKRAEKNSEVLRKFIEYVKKKIK